MECEARLRGRERNNCSKTITGVRVIVAVSVIDERCEIHPDWAQECAARISAVAE
jgi:hypothetical protein